MQYGNRPTPLNMGFQNNQNNQNIPQNPNNNNNPVPPNRLPSNPNSNQNSSNNTPTSNLKNDPLSTTNPQISEEEQLRRQAEDEKNRFTIELEFIQCLANPHYLHFLAQRGYFNDDSMVNYLKYLNYWRKPEYARHLRYPQCLYMLELLQNSSFREAISNQQCAKFIEDQILLQWQYYIRKRGKIVENGSETVQNNKNGDKITTLPPNTNNNNNTSSSKSTSGAVPLRKTTNADEQQKMAKNNILNGNIVVPSSSSSSTSNAQVK